MSDEKHPLPDPGFTLLDGVTPGEHDITLEYGSQHLVASDLSRPLEERLEAFEDIFDSRGGRHHPHPRPQHRARGRACGRST